MAEAGSFLANAAARRRTLTAARDVLLDRPGIARRGGPPPPTVPAQGKTSPQQDALAKRPQPPEQAQLPGEPAPAPGQQPQPAGDQLGLDPEQRAEFLGQITSFLEQMKAERRAELHPSIGRVRRFFGSG